MRDEHAQQSGLLGDKIAHVALLAFINRNYTHDEQGRWYFQNGPQRVYVDLEATPFIARTDAEQGLLLHTGEVLDGLDEIWITSSGQMVLTSHERVAQIDDRDVVQCMEWLTIDDKPASDEQVIAWIEGKADTGVLMFQYAGSRMPAKHLGQEDIAAHFGFVRKPQLDLA